MLVLSVCETTCFYYQHYDNYFFANATLVDLAFGAIATGHFHFRNNEAEDMLLYQSNPVRVKLFSYRNTLVGFMVHNFCTEIQASEVKIKISSFDLFNRKQC